MILIFMFLTAALVFLFWLMYTIGDGFPHVPLSWGIFALIVAALIGLGIHVEKHHQVTQCWLTTNADSLHTRSHNLQCEQNTVNTERS